jgi:hypothetical protein
MFLFDRTLPSRSSKTYQMDLSKVYDMIMQSSDRTQNVTGSSLSRALPLGGIPAEDIPGIQEEITVQINKEILRESAVALLIQSLVDS